MGCFDSTCAFSRTSVHHGDEVIMVVTKANYIKDTYNLGQRVYEYQESRARARENANDPEYIKLWQPRSPFVYIGIGIYNDYGSIESFDIDPLKDKGEFWDYHFFCHKSVAEGLVDATITEENLEAAVIKLVGIAFLARIQLFGNTLLGEQYYSKDEIILQRKLSKLRESVLDRQWEYLKQYDEEDEVEPNDIEGEDTYQYLITIKCRSTQAYIETHKALLVMPMPEDTEVIDDEENLSFDINFHGLWNGWLRDLLGLSKNSTEAIIEVTRCDNALIDYAFFIGGEYYLDTQSEDFERPQQPPMNEKPKELIDIEQNNQ